MQNDPYINYWDFISAQDLIDYSDVDTLNSIAIDSFENLQPMLEDMTWVDANVLYLALIYEISQSQIGDYLGISQFGVSKRYRKALQRLKTKASRPSTDYAKVRDELLPVFGEDSIGIAMALYIFNNLNVTLTTYAYETKESVFEKVNAFISAKDDPVNQAIIAHGLHHLNPAQLKQTQEFNDIQANEAKIVTASTKYGAYFKMILDTTSIGEAVFNKAKNADTKWKARFL